ncbi:MAG: hypothetical protein LBC90_02620 [Candidatus Adiutrix sp.]|jgi:hypothetical protein|nr:hypothetical protein [Candidatus Adiutrix sp.]
MAKKITLLLMVAALSLAGCAKTKPPQPFDVPIESRLILQVPFFSAETTAGAAGALAEVMTYNGRPVTAERIVLALGKKNPTPHALVVWARTEGLRARYYNADPPLLVKSVREGRPLIVRLGAAVTPLAAGDYAVVAGYNPEGVVINSRSIHQQIIAWGPFLSAWLKARNLAIEITTPEMAPEND